MTRNEKYTAHIAEVVRTRYAQDVSLLVLYGSHQNGTENAWSDVDLYFVPATDRAMELCRTFLIEGVGYDLFPVDWARLGRIADFSDPLSPLLGEAKVLYCQSAKDGERFEALRKAQAENLQNPAHMLGAARQRLRQAKEVFASLCLEDGLGKARSLAGYAMILLSDACAYRNGRYFRRGLKGQMADLAEMDLLPAGFLADYRAVVAARTVPALRAYCRHALRGTEALLREGEGETPPALRPEALADMLRESVSTFNKIHVCAQTGNAALAFISGVCLEGALEEMRQEAGAPACDLLSYYDEGDLHAFDRRAQEVLASLVSAVERGGADMQPYATMDDFISAH